MKIFVSVTLALSLLGVAGAASAANSTSMHPRSFDYYDQNGVEHTGIDLNLRGISRPEFSVGREDSADVRHHRSRTHRELVRYYILSPVWSHAERFAPG
jgi:hypothetical protein